MQRETNPLRRVNADASESFKHLKSTLADAVLLEDAVSELLRDPFVPDELIEHVQGVHLYGRQLIEPTKEDDAITGATGFIVFAHAMEVAARTGDPRVTPEPPTGLLRLSSVDAFFRRWYRLPPGREQAASPASDGHIPEATSSANAILTCVELKDAEPYRVGTTSFILKKVGITYEDQDLPSTVLKCLRPRFATYGTIEEETAEYQDTQPAETFAPKVYGSGARYISMSFIDGATLDDLLVDLIESPTDAAAPLSKERRELLLKVLAVLRQRLPSLARPHCDLSPWNIMIETDTSAVRLIDFGKNFILEGEYTSSEAAQRARRFIAPELASRDRDHSRSDVYSVGMIILDLLMRPRSVPKGDPRDDLDRLWRDSPALAELVEDLVEENPAQRAVLTCRPTADGAVAQLIAHPTLAQIYRHTERIVMRENQFFADVLRADSDRRVTHFNLLQVARFTIDQFVRLGATLKKYKNSPHADVRDAHRLLRVARWSLILGGLLFAGLFAETLLDVGASQWQSLASKNPFFPIGHPHIYEHLELRVIPVSIGLVAVMYYLNIFATISTAGLVGFRTRLLGIVMRASGVLPVSIQFVCLVFPRWWGLLAIAGGAITSANSFLAVRFAEQVERDSPFSGEVLEPNFVGYFGKWAPSLLLYSSTVAVVWVFWRYGHVHDLAVYATVIVIGNLVKMYYQNCVSDAPEFSANVARAIGAERRRAALGVRQQTVPRGAEAWKPDVMPGFSESQA